MPCTCSSAGLWFVGILAVIFAAPLADFLIIAWPWAVALLFGGFAALVIGTGMHTHWRKTGRIGWQP